MIGALNKIFQDAAETTQSITKGIKALFDSGNRLGTTHTERAEGLAESITGLSEALKRLHSNEFQGGVLKKPLRVGTIKFETDTPLAKVQNRIQKELEEAITTAKESQAYKAVTRKIEETTATKVAEEAAEVASKPGFLGRHFFGAIDKLDHALDKHSTGRKLGIAATGITLGGVFIGSGMNWLFRGIEGNEPHYNVQADGTLLTVSRPMSPSKRAAAILGGVAAGATGIASEIVGFFSLYKALIS